MQRGIIKNVKDFKYLLPSAIALLLTIIIISCNSTEPERKINISVEDVSCTEVWLKLEGATSNEIKLERDGLEINNYTVLEGNILYDDGLQPNTEYTYKATLVNDAEKNMEATATTLDTTSSNYTWEKFYFGDIGSSILKDVAIIDENNIWAVGDIMIREDGNDYSIFAIAKWNGIEWKLIKLEHNCRLYYPNCGPDTIWQISASSIFAYAADNIWISAGGVHHYNGSKWTEEAGIYGAGRANEIWGNKDGLWFVGNDGFIARRSSDGSWTKIESGTDLDIQDIWGSYDEASGKLEILAIASNHLSGYDREILKIEGEKVIKMSNEPLTSTIYSVWFIPRTKYIIGGSGVYSKIQLVQERWKKEDTIGRYYTYRIRGNSINDIILVGGYGDIQHYNGKNWGSQYEATRLDGNYNSVAIKGNIVAAVGFNNTRAVITIGRR